MSAASIMCQALSAAASHGLDEPPQVSLGCSLPLCLNEAPELLQVFWWRVVVLHSALQRIPKVLNGVEIRTTGWPVHPDNPCLLEKGVYQLSTVRRGVVIHVNGLGSNLL